MVNVDQLMRDVFAAAAEAKISELQRTATPYHLEVSFSVPWNHLEGDNAEWKREAALTARVADKLTHWNRRLKREKELMEEDKPLPLVMIEWEDSVRPHSEWAFNDDLEALRPVRCLSVGWLLRDELSYVVILPNRAYGWDLDDEGNLQDPHQGCGAMCIPTSAIVKRTNLYEGVPEPLKLD